MFQIQAINEDGEAWFVESRETIEEIMVQFFSIAPLINFELGGGPTVLSITKRTDQPDGAVFVNENTLYSWIVVYPNEAFVVSDSETETHYIQIQKI